MRKNTSPMLPTSLSFSLALSSSFASFLPRSFMYVPASSKKFISKIEKLALMPDLPCLDLEDGVAASQKYEALKLAKNALKSSNNSFQWAVRINVPGWENELEQVYGNIENFAAKSKSTQNDDVPVQNLKNFRPHIVVPKVESPKDLAPIINYMNHIDLTYGSNLLEKNLLILIESPLGVENISQIIQPYKNRIGSVIFGAEDYLKYLGIKRSPSMSELVYPRTRILNACYAYGIHPIDAVCTQIRDISALENEAAAGAALGYRGKQCVHPDQIETINRQFLPPKELYEESHHIVSEFDKHGGVQGAGAIDINGISVDLPEYLRAKAIVERYETYV